MNEDQKFVDIFESYGADIHASSEAHRRAAQLLKERPSPLGRWVPIAVAAAAPIAVLVLWPSRSASAASVLRKAEMALEGVASMKVEFYRLRGDGIYHHVFDRTFAGTSNRFEQLEGVKKGWIVVHNPQGTFFYAKSRGVTLKLPPGEEMDSPGPVTPLQFAKNESAIGGWSDAHKTVRLDPTAKREGSNEIYCVVTEDDKGYASRLFVDKKSSLPLQLDTVQDLGDGRIATSRQLFKFDVPVTPQEFEPIQPVIDQEVAAKAQMRKWQTPIAVVGTTPVLDLQTTKQGYVFIAYRVDPKWALSGSAPRPTTLTDSSGRLYVKLFDFEGDVPASSKSASEVKFAMWFPLHTKPGKGPYRVVFANRLWDQTLESPKMPPNPIFPAITLNGRQIDGLEPDYSSAFNLAGFLRDMDRAVLARRGSAYFAENKYDQARIWFSRARDAWLSIGSDGYPPAGHITKQIADCEDILGNHDQATQLRNEAERLRRW